MPKTKSAFELKRYPSLREIPDDEWDEMFDQHGKPWTSGEETYLREWYGRVSTLEMAYSLGRLPRSVQLHANRIGLFGKRPKN